MTDSSAAQASALDLTVLGSINADVTAVTERLPGPGETVGGGRLTRSAGGKGANQAAAAARLGARTRMVGAVGRDAEGDAMLAALQEAGVDTDPIRRVDAATGTAVIVVDSAGENQIAVCEGANAQVSTDGIRIDPDSTVLAQLEISLETVTRVAREHRGYMALNAAPAMPLPAELVDACDLIIVNETEYALTPQLAEARLVAVTYGSKGAALRERGVEVAFADAVPTTPVNTVGAGDAFCSALTIALRIGMPYGDALRTANAVGAAAVLDPDAQAKLAPLAHYTP